VNIGVVLATLIPRLAEDVFDDKAILVTIGICNILSDQRLESRGIQVMGPPGGGDGGGGGPSRGGRGGGPSRGKSSVPKSTSEVGIVANLPRRRAERRQEVPINSRE